MDATKMKVFFLNKSYLRLQTSGDSIFSRENFFFRVHWLSEIRMTAIGPDFPDFPWNKAWKTKNKKAWKTNGWNLKITCLKRTTILQTSIFGFHVSFRGSRGHWLRLLSEFSNEHVRSLALRKSSKGSLPHCLLTTAPSTLFPKLERICNQKKEGSWNFVSMEIVPSQTLETKAKFPTMFSRFFFLQIFTPSTT